MKRLIRIGERHGVLDLRHSDGEAAARLRWEEEPQVELGLEFLEVEAGVYSLMWNGRSVEARVVESRHGWVVELFGERLEVEVEDPRAASAKRKVRGKSGIEEIASLMPGKVVRVLVEAGTQVDEGQGLVVVEAMKMQNEIKAPRAGKVLTVAAVSGANVLAGEVLVTLE